MSQRANTAASSTVTSVQSIEVKRDKAKGKVWSYSPEYQVWRIKRGLIPGYVAILITPPFFVSLIQFHCVGAVKQRLYVENLLEICVPNISLEEQLKIAAERKLALERIAVARDRVKITKAEIEELILGTKQV